LAALNVSPLCRDEIFERLRILNEIVIYGERLKKDDATFQA